MAVPAPAKPKLSLPKRDVPAVLEPLDYKPTPKEDIDVVQIAKQKHQRDSSKHNKPRPVLLESLGPPSQARI
ncbi:hypothetical protein PINS_up000307 [Pythium insidiosum]|nr:hypothetical protein PINS_up000307 [Pythium insidiosum]